MTCRARWARHSVRAQETGETPVLLCESEKTARNLFSEALPFDALAYLLKSHLLIERRAISLRFFLGPK